MRPCTPGQTGSGCFERLEERALLTPTASIVSAYAENAALVVTIDYLNADPATLGAGDIQYAANGRPAVPALVRAGPTPVNGKLRMVYGMPAYDGAWGVTDTGTYRITSPVGQVLGAQGQALPNLNLASYWLWFNQPKARLISQSLGPTTWALTVQYDSANGIDESTIGADDVGLMGGTPAGKSVLGITHVSATTLRVVYSITAPNGSWNFSSNGAYSLLVNGSAVADTDGRQVTGHGLGSYYLWFNTPKATMGTVTAGDTLLFTTVTFTAAPGEAIAAGSVVSLNAVTILGPNGYSAPGHMDGLVHNGDGSYTVTYSSIANGGSWDYRDSGSYSLRVNPGQVQDINGHSVASFVVGSGSVSFTAPAAAVQLPTFPTHTQWNFSIEFSDDVGVDSTTVNTASIRLEGPDGGDIPVQLTGFTVTIQGTVIARYTLSAPGGLDNGQYNIWVNPDGIRDTQGNSVNEGVAGSFWLFF